MKIKLIRQFDETDCGPTCLAMISRYYGKNVSVTKIRELAKTDKFGTSIFGLIQAGKELGLLVEAYELDEIKELEVFNHPIIAHVKTQNNFEHFIVIEKTLNGKVIIKDPDKGSYSLTYEEFYEIFTLIILDINKEKHFSKSNEVTTVRKVLMPLLKNNVKFLILIIVISLLINLVGIAGALYFQYLIDDIIPIEDFHALHKVSASILLLYFINLFVSFFRYYLSLKISLNIDYSLMKKYYNHVIKLPSSFFDNRKTGEILSRFNDIHNIRESLSSVTVTLFVDLILVLGGSIILYQESGILLLLCSCILPIYIILSLVLKRPFEINNRKLMEESAVLSSYLIESFENNLIIKSYNYENDMYSRGKKRFNSLVNKALKLGLYNNYQLSISNFVNIFISLIVLWVGSYLVIDKELTLGSLIAFNALLIYFLDPFERIINMQPIIQSSIVAIKRVGEIFDLETEKREKSMFRPLQNAIVFNDVCFQYGFRRDILSNVNMTFTKGKKVGIVGSSGSGKSTIGKLLIQLYSCQNGNIYWDGKPIEDLSLMKLRDNIGYVPQDDFWFNGSIIENLTLNKKNVSKEVVIQACKESGAHDFISDLTNKYESIIENGGGNLSGGQKQKLSIARALIKDPDIYIFDEPTSSLDTLSEYKILELLEKLSSNNKTIILISHKLKSIANSDYIYVLKHGRIIEEGSHNELIFNGSEYKSLWEKQCAR